MVSDYAGFVGRRPRVGDDSADCRGVVELGYCMTRPLASEELLTRGRGG